MLVIKQQFDPDWYLATYSDVANAGAEPWQHYQQYGRFEGRLPCRVFALELEYELWQTLDAKKLIPLLQLCHAENALECETARWVLARWYGSENAWSKAYDVLNEVNDWPVLTQLLGHTGPQLLLFESALWLNKRAEASEVLASEKWPDLDKQTVNDKQLARAMLAKQPLDELNNLWQAEGLSPITCSADSMSLDSLQAHVLNESWWRRLRYSLMPRVSVIIPCFNAENTIATSLESLQQQRYRNLEIIVVDDASTDNSAAVVKQFTAKDRRIKLVEHKQNQGAYAARNSALQRARGQYITTQDSDDWSHPDKLLRQVALLQTDQDIMACRSHWVRTTESLQFTRWRMEDGWIYPNISSLMFRREVFKKLGFWDRVSVNADTEYYQRIIAYYGEKAIADVLPSVPLSFGRVDQNSLSQTSATHLRTQFKGVRQRYQQAAAEWHQRSDKSMLYLAAEPPKRAFHTPALIDRAPTQYREQRLLARLKSSDIFDEEFYLRQNPDVRESELTATEHYLHHGRFEGRAANPLFCAAAYELKTGVPIELALFDAAECATAAAPVVLSGGQQNQASAEKVLLVGHQVTEYQFGAELSLITLAEQFKDLGYVVSMLLPDAGNPEYIKRLKPFCQQLIFIPYIWWHQGRVIESQQVKVISQFIQEQNIGISYNNTAVLWEPLVAAEQARVPAVVHIREWLTDDDALASVLGTDSQGWLSHVNASASHAIANSQSLATELQSQLEVPLSVIHNIVDDRLFSIERNTDSKRLRVGIISSNLPKKGIADFFALASASQSSGFDHQFFVFGPATDTLSECLSQSSIKNIHVMGYKQDADELYRSLDVIVNFSHFPESFGRTVAEGMAAGCPAIVYDQGALPDLVNAGGGFVIERGNIAAASNAIETLMSHSTYSSLSVNARQSAQRYRSGSVRQSLKQLMSSLTA